MKEKRFYLVYSPSGNNPRYRHATFAEAKKEAERLAGAVTTNGEFYVVMAITKAQRVTVQTEDLEPILDEEIPF